MHFWPFQINMKLLNLVFPYLSSFGYIHHYLANLTMLHLILTFTYTRSILTLNLSHLTVFCHVTLIWPNVHSILISCDVHVQRHVPVRTCTSSCTCTYMYIVMYLYVHVQHHVPVRTCTTSCTCMYMYNVMYLYVHVHRHVPVCTCIWLHILIYKILCPIYPFLSNKPYFVMTLHPFLPIFTLI